MVQGRGLKDLENSISAKAETVLGFLAKIIFSILNPLVEAMVE